MEGNDGKQMKKKKAMEENELRNDIVRNGFDGATSLVLLLVLLNNFFFEISSGP